DAARLLRKADAEVAEVGHLAPQRAVRVGPRVGLGIEPRQRQFLRQEGGDRGGQFALFVGGNEIDHDALGPRGRPRMRSPMMLRWRAGLPAAMVLAKERR